MNTLVQFNEQYHPIYLQHGNNTTLPPYAVNQLSTMKSSCYPTMLLTVHVNETFAMIIFQAYTAIDNLH